MHNGIIISLIISIIATGYQQGECIPCLACSRPVSSLLSLASRFIFTLTVCMHTYRMRILVHSGNNIIIEELHILNTAADR